MTLPSAGDWVVVLVTAVISPTRFFVQLPLGNRNPFTYSQRDYDSVEGKYLVANSFQLAYQGMTCLRGALVLIKQHC